MVTLKIFFLQNCFFFQEGDVDTVRALLDTGVQVDVKGQYLATPLNWASAGTKAGADMVKLLLSRGADIESRNSYNNTPLATAAMVILNFLSLGMKNFICIQELFLSFVIDISHVCNLS